MDLCVDLHTAVFWYHFVRDGDAFMDGNTLVDYGVMFHTARGELHWLWEMTPERETGWKGGERSYLDMLSILSIFLMPSQCRICETRY